MEKKSKIKIATFWGIILAAGGLGADSSKFSGDGIGYYISLIVFLVVIPLIGVGLLSWVAGEIYSSKNKWKNINYT